MFTAIRNDPFTYLILGLGLVALGVLLIIAGIALLPLGVAVIPIILGVLVIGGGLVLILASLPQALSSLFSGFSLFPSGTSDVGGPKRGLYFPKPAVPGFGVPVTGIGPENPLPTPAGTCVLTQFEPPVADHYVVFPPSGLADLLVDAGGGPYTVEVSHSPSGPFETCTTGSQNRTSAQGVNRWDVPFTGSAWDWVRVCAVGPIELRGVQDIDY